MPFLRNQISLDGTFGNGRICNSYTLIHKSKEKHNFKNLTLHRMSYVIILGEIETDIRFR